MADSPARTAAGRSALVQDRPRAPTRRPPGRPTSPRPSACSGAMYAGVPSTAPVRVRSVRRVRPLGQPEVGDLRVAVRRRTGRSPASGPGGRSRGVGGVDAARAIASAQAAAGRGRAGPAAEAVGERPAGAGTPSPGTGGRPARRTRRPGRRSGARAAAIASASARNRISSLGSPGQPRGPSSARRPVQARAAGPGTRPPSRPGRPRPRPRTRRSREPEGRASRPTLAGAATSPGAGGVHPLGRGHPHRARFRRQLRTPGRWRRPWPAATRGPAGSGRCRAWRNPWRLTPPWPGVGPGRSGSTSTDPEPLAQLRDRRPSGRRASPATRSMSNSANLA